MKRHSVLGLFGHTTWLAVAAAALSLWGTSAQALGPNLVQNPSFETNTGTQFQGMGFLNLPGLTPANFPGWTVTPGLNTPKNALAFVYSNNVNGGSAFFISSWPLGKTNSGTYFFGADGDWNDTVFSSCGPGCGADLTATISQTINGLIVGYSYNLTFEWAAAQQNSGLQGPFNSGWKIQFGSSIDSVDSGTVAAQSFSGWSNYSRYFTATSASQTLSFLSSGTPGGQPPISLLDNVSITMADAPGPLGILGVATAYGYSRRLRRRIGRD